MAALDKEVTCSAGSLEGEQCAGRIAGDPMKGFQPRAQWRPLRLLILRHASFSACSTSANRVGSSWMGLARRVNSTRTFVLPAPSEDQELNDRGLNAVQAEGIVVFE